MWIDLEITVCVRQRNIQRPLIFFGNGSDIDSVSHLNLRWNESNPSHLTVLAPVSEQERVCFSNWFWNNFWSEILILDSELIIQNWKKNCHLSTPIKSCCVKIVAELFFFFSQKKIKSNSQYENESNGNQSSCVDVALCISCTRVD